MEKQKQRKPDDHQGENKFKPPVALPVTLQNFPDFDLNAYAALVFQIACVQLKCVRKMAMAKTNRLSNMRRQTSFNTCMVQCVHDERWIDQLVQEINMLNMEPAAEPEHSEGPWHPRLHSSKWINDHNNATTKSQPVAKAKPRAARKRPM